MRSALDLAHLVREGFQHCVPDVVGLAESCRVLDGVLQGDGRQPLT